MVSITRQSGRDAAYLTEFVCDTKADMAELPGVDTITVGSVCTVIEPFGVYMLNSKGEWKAI